ncbi:hypothetical protein ES703_15692 [subsurface metagenome]
MLKLRIIKSRITQMWKFIPKWILLSIALAAVIGFAIGYIWKSNEMDIRLMRREILRQRNRRSRATIGARADSIIAGDERDYPGETMIITHGLQMEMEAAQHKIDQHRRRLQLLYDVPPEVQKLRGISPMPLRYRSRPLLPGFSDLDPNRPPGPPDPNWFEVQRNSSRKSRYSAAERWRVKSKRAAAKQQSSNKAAARE